MLRRFAFGFLGVAAAATVIAGCASGGATQTVAIGPSFAPQSLYATNATQNGISIYTGTSGGPAYQISTGGSTNGLNGPQYLAFDANSNLVTTNYSSATATGSIVVIAASATGNVLPFNSISTGNAHLRGIADYKLTQAGSQTTLDTMVAGEVDPSQPVAFQSNLLIFTASGLYSVERVGGPATGLNVPSGIAVDKSGLVYVTNLQGPSGVSPASSAGSVEVFALPTSSPTPAATATPSPTPSPTATPTGATATPSPTPFPTATPVNIAPATTIAGPATGINHPTGIAIDASGNIYVSDTASTICNPGGTPTCPAILVFSAGASGNVAPKAIAGAATKLFAPTDVKVDTSGKIYVADSTAGGAGVIYVFAAGTTGNLAPVSTFTSTGSVIGLGLAP